MESVASQLIEEVTAYAQSDSLKDAQEICAAVFTFRITYACGMYMEHHSSTGSVNLNTQLQLNSIFRLVLLRLFLLNNSNLFKFS